MGYIYLWVLLALALALFAQINVKTTYAKYQDIRNARGISGADAARQILDANGLYQVQIEQIGGELTDHFDPRTNIVSLSGNVYNGTSLAAVGVAAHEVGHAIQYAQQYAPMQLRAAVVPATQIGSFLSYPLVLLGLIFGSGMLLDFGIILFSIVVLFQFITLPVEFNASHRAMQTIDSLGILEHDEQQGATKVLMAAALTYVAALIMAIVQLARLLAIRGRR